MLKSLYTTATGMKAQQTMVDMIANNIANVNTAGFKKSQASFEDLLYVTIESPGLQQNQGGTSAPIGLQIGSGSRLSGTTKIYSPGTLEITERTLDVAIDGAGFFQILLADGSTGYTRDGHFLVNSEGPQKYQIPRDAFNASRIGITLLGRACRGLAQERRGTPSWRAAPVSLGPCLGRHGPPPSAQGGDER